MSVDTKKTMTVRELKDFLDNFPDDMRVFAEWENVDAPILEENFKILDGYLSINVECY